MSELLTMMSVPCHQYLVLLGGRACGGKGPLPLHKFWSFDQCVPRQHREIDSADCRQANFAESASEVQFFPQQLIDELKKSFPAPSQIQAFTWPLALYGKDTHSTASGWGEAIGSHMKPYFCRLSQWAAAPRVKKVPPNGGGVFVRKSCDPWSLARDLTVRT